MKCDQPENYQSIFKNRSILIAAGTLIALIAVSISLKTYDNKPAITPAQPGTPQTQQEDKSLQVIEMEPELEPEGPPPDYLTNRKVLEDALASESLGGPPFGYLLYQAKVTKVDFLAKDAKPAPKPDEANKYPPGTPVTLEGKVRIIESHEEFGIPEVRIPSAVLYEITDADGKLYVVYSVYRIHGIDRGDRVSVTGFYYKHFIHQPGLEPLDIDWNQYDEPPILPERKPLDPVLAPVIITKGPSAPWYMTDPKSIEGVRDREFGFERKPFYYLLSQVQGMTHEQLAAQADPKITKDIMWKNPQQARGKVVVLDGTLKRIRRVSQEPNVAGIKQLYYSIIKLPEGEWVWVYSFEEPVGFKNGDSVRVCGKYFKLQRYLSANKTELFANVVMAQRLVPVVYKTFPYVQIGAMIVGGIIVIGLGIAWHFERREREVMSEHLRGISAKLRPRNIDELAKKQIQKVNEENQASEKKEEPPRKKLEPRDKEEEKA